MFILRALFFVFARTHRFAYWTRTRNREINDCALRSAWHLHAPLPGHTHTHTSLVYWKHMGEMFTEPVSRKVASWPYLCNVITWFGNNQFWETADVKTGYIHSWSWVCCSSTYPSQPFVSYSNKMFICGWEVPMVSHFVVAPPISCFDTIFRRHVHTCYLTGRVTLSACMYLYTATHQAGTEECLPLQFRAQFVIVR